jgi:hypothetical protein
MEVTEAGKVTDLLIDCRRALSLPAASPADKSKLIASFDKVIPEVEVRAQIVNCILGALSKAPAASPDALRVLETLGFHIKKWTCIGSTSSKSKEGTKAMNETFCQKRQDREVFWVTVALFACLILLFLFGCGAHKSPRPFIGAPPNFEGKCSIGYQYNHWSQKCEKYPGEGIHGCGVEVEQADGSTWVTPCWPESKWKKPYCVKGCK